MFLSSIAAKKEIFNIKLQADVPSTLAQPYFRMAEKVGQHLSGMPMTWLRQWKQGVYGKKWVYRTLPWPRLECTHPRRHCKVKYAVYLNKKVVQTFKKTFRREQIMKIAIIGGAGAMARTTVRDLSENNNVTEILVADYQDKKAIRYAGSFNDPRIKGCFVDATDINATADLIKNYDAVVNSAQHYVNLDIMKACIKAKVHYIDLGGLFYFTRKQLKLDEEFKAAGVSAILGMGAAPGITNVLSRYAYDRLDTVDSVQLFFASADFTDMKGIDMFLPPYSIRTIMEEYSEDSEQFIDGEYQIVPPISGKMTVDFPEPIGRRECIHTLHSEPATIPSSFKDKGVKEVTWRLSLPEVMESQANFLANIGMGGKTPVKVGGCEIAPVDCLASVVQRHVDQKLTGVELEPKDSLCIRSLVSGTKDGRPMEYIVDCIGRSHSRWNCSSVDVATGIPPAIVSAMQVEGVVAPGVWAPEQVVDPDRLFKALARREMTFHIMRKEKIA